MSESISLNAQITKTTGEIIIALITSKDLSGEYTDDGYSAKRICDAIKEIDTTLRNR